ncbi:MAG: isochorismatase family protein, partial [Nitrospirae bacterium]|nr:isochorismatase family protein [Nitrospirota bacterium]
MNIFTINPDDTVLLIVDIQEKLVAVVEDKEALTANTLNLVETAKLHSVPIVVTEQYPKGLGSTVKELKDAIKGIEIWEKMTF